MLHIIGRAQGVLNSCISPYAVALEVIRLSGGGSSEVYAMASEIMGPHREVWPARWPTTGSHHSVLVLYLDYLVTEA